ncbi:MAG TPA: alpha/beta fold hydrolase [Chloroflexota bacterium]
MSRFILVHGAWHGAWCWDRVVPLLEARGHLVDAIDLPGHGRDRTPTAEVTLDRYAERVCRALEAQPEPAVLVGHSMAGVVITEAAERCPERIQTLVYLAAYLPSDGETLLHLADRPEGATTYTRPNLVFSDDHRSVTLRPESLREALYADCQAADIERASRLLVPQAAAPFATPVHTTEERFGRVPRAYVVCSRDRAIPTALQWRMLCARPCQQVTTLQSSHSPFLSAPDTLAAQLDVFARNTRLAGPSAALGGRALAASV